VFGQLNKGIGDSLGENKILIEHAGVASRTYSSLLYIFDQALIDGYLGWCPLIVIGHDISVVKAGLSSNALPQLNI
jgi:hypothetical protein